MEEQKDITARLAALSHQLRSPLSAIRGYNSLLLEGGQGPLTEKQRRSLHIMRQSILELVQMVDDLVDHQSAPSPPVALPSAAAKLRVAVVEDDVEISELMQFVLSERGHQVHRLRSGGEALELDRPMDLFVVDLTLQNESGLALCAALKQRSATRDIPIFVVTASSTASVRAEALQHGAAAVLVKPFELGEFVRQVEQIAASGLRRLGRA